MRKSECGLRPVGGIGAYAPEGMRKKRKAKRKGNYAKCGEHGAKGIEQ
jgi:hypothetical protein